MNKTENLKIYLSLPRLRPYLLACGHDVQKGLELYQLNMRLSSSFLPLLSLVEVSIRNAVDREFTKLFKTEDWFTPYEELLREENKKKMATLISKFGNPPSGYTDAEPLKSAADLIKKNRNKLINEKKNKIRNDKKIYLRKLQWYKDLNEFEQIKRLEVETKEEIEQKKHKLFVTPSEMIAEATFGFWTSLFKIELYKVTPDVLLDIFPNRGKANRESIEDALDDIRRFRNRVAHNETICFVDEKFDLTDVNKVYEDCKKVLHLLNKDLEVYSEELYIIHDDLRNIENFIVRLPIILGFEDRYR